MTRTLFVVSASLPDGIPVQADGPKKDYAAISERLGADLLDWSAARKTLLLRLLCSIIGIAVVQAIRLCRWRRYDVILTDGTATPIPLALLLKLAQSKKAHVTIGHRAVNIQEAAVLQAPAGGNRTSARWCCTSMNSTTWRLEQLGVHPGATGTAAVSGRSELLAPDVCARRAAVTSAGLEYRDYPTLFQAVDGLGRAGGGGCEPLVQAAEHAAQDAPLPANVTVGSFNYHELRNLFARAAIVAVPVDDVDFQAGVTTILEAMAMGKAVIVTHTYGQTDVIHDRRLGDARR